MQSAERRTQNAECRLEESYRRDNCGKDQLTIDQEPDPFRGAHRRKIIDVVTAYSRERIGLSIGLFGMKKRWLGLSHPLPSVTHKDAPNCPIP